MFVKKSVFFSDFFQIWLAAVNLFTMMTLKAMRERPPY